VIAYRGIGQKASDVAQVVKKTQDTPRWITPSSSKLRNPDPRPCSIGAYRAMPRWGEYFRDQDSRRCRVYDDLSKNRTPGIARISLLPRRPPGREAFRVTSLFALASTGARCKLSEAKGGRFVDERASNRDAGGDISADIHPKRNFGLPTGQDIFGV